MTNVQAWGIARGEAYVRAWDLYQPTSRNHNNPCFSRSRSREQVLLPGVALRFDGYESAVIFGDAETLLVMNTLDLALIDPVRAEVEDPDRPLACTPRRRREAGWSRICKNAPGCCGRSYARRWSKKERSVMYLQRRDRGFRAHGRSQQDPHALIRLDGASALCAAPWMLSLSGNCPWMELYPDGGISAAQIRPGRSKACQRSTNLSAIAT
jgi:hypothetical protein